MIDFGGKCNKHPNLKKMFPTNPAVLENPHFVKSREQFHVNFARSAGYNESANPSIQRRINTYFTIPSTSLPLLTKIVSYQANVFAIYDHKL